MARRQLPTERDEKSTRYHDGLLSVCRPVSAIASVADSSEELMSKVQLLYEDSGKVPVSAGLSSQFAENSPRARELESQIARKKIERAAVVAFADASKRKLDAL